MKTRLASVETRSDTIRAGVISSSVLAIGYLYLTGFSNLPRVWAFIILSAICLVLMLKSVIDLLVLALGFSARCIGRGLGHTVKMLRRLG